MGLARIIHEKTAPNLKTATQWPITNRQICVFQALLDHAVEEFAATVNHSWRVISICYHARSHARNFVKGARCQKNSRTKKDS